MVLFGSKTITIPAAWAGKELKLDLGPVDDNDVTWFNGKIIDENYERWFMDDGAPLYCAC